MVDALKQVLTVLVAFVSVLGGTLLLDLPRRAATWTSQLFLTQILKGTALLASSLTLLQVIRHVMTPAQGAIFWVLAALVILPFGVWYVTQYRPRPVRNALAYVGMLVAVHLSLLINAPSPPSQDVLLRVGLATLGALLATIPASMLFRTTASLRWRLGAVALGYTAATLLIATSFGGVPRADALQAWPALSAVAVLTFLDALLLGLFIGAQRLGEETRRHAAALTLEQAVQQVLSDHLNDAVVICDAEGCIIRLNARAKADFDLQPGGLDCQWYDQTFTSLLTTAQRPMTLALSGVTVRNLLFGLAFPDSRRIARVSAGPLLSPDGARLGAVMTLTDVTTERAAQAAQVELTRQYTEIVDALDEGVILISPDGQVQQSNARVNQLLGLSRDDTLRIKALLDAQNVQYAGSQPAPQRGENFRRLLAGRALVTEEIVQMDRLDGRRVSLRVRGQALRRDGQVDAVLYTLTDISDQVTLRQEVDRLSHHWILTGLPTRAHFLTLAAKQQAEWTALLLVQNLSSAAARRDGQVAFADAVTKQFARDLPLTHPGALLIGQLGDDTFALLLPHADTPLQPGFRQTLDLHGEQVELQFKAAIRTLTTGEELEEALQEAEATLVHTEEGQLGVSEPAQYQAQLRGAQLERRLRIALQTRSFTTYFQPIYHLQGRHLVKAEALVRWFDDDLGFVPPDAFIPLLEAWNRVHVVTDLVIAAALTESRRLSALTGTTVRIGVNLSAVGLNAPDFLERIQTLLRSEPDAAERLGFEITERAALDHLPEVTRRLHILRDLGFQLALDDFGTGYSALSVLQRLPVHFVKLDRSFVQELETSERLQVLTDAVMQLAQRLHFQVIAEGIETAEQELILRRLHCDLGQGYLYARPHPQLVLASSSPGLAVDALATQPHAGAGSGD